MTETHQGLNDIVVLGAGAIGSVLGTFLQRAAGPERTIHLVGRERLMTPISRSGLTYQPYGATGPDQALTAQGFATHTSASEIERADVLFLTVKAHGLRNALEEAGPLLSSQPWVVIAMNGLGLRELVAEYVPDTRITEAIANYPCRLEANEQSVAVLSTGGNANFAFQDTPFSREILPELFDAHEFDTRVEETFREAQWKKALANIAMNALSAMTVLKVGEVLDRPPLCAILEELIREAVAVATAEGVDLHEDMVASFYKFASHDPDHRTSMYWDLQRKRPTEVGLMNGYVVRQGARLGIATPTNRALYDLMQVVEGAQTP